MSPTSESEVAKSRSVHEKPLRTRMLEGAGMIAFASVFTMFRVPWEHPFSIGSRLIALCLASLGGAVGGIAYYASDSLRSRGGISKTAANVASIFAYCIAAAVFVAVWVFLADPH
jgi:hypothetical protein